MPMLTLNEITIGTHTKRANERFEVIGDQARAFDGSWLETRTSEKRVWEIQTPVLPQVEGEAFKRLLEGQGHNWTFDVDRFSTGKGLGPSVGPAAGAITAGGKFGGFFMRLSAAEQITWPTGFGNPTTNDYTILLFEDADAAQDRWAIKNVQGVVTKFLNGVSSAAATPFVSVDTSGDITIGDGAGAFDIDDLVFVPFAMPDVWLTTGGGLDAPTRAFPNLPALEADGDFVNNQVVEVQSRSGSVRTRARRFPGVSSDKYGHVVFADLMET